MAFTMLPLFAFYIIFAGLLAWYFDGLFIMTEFMGASLFVQFLSSDRIVLYNMGANIVGEDGGSQVWKLHAMVDRLSQRMDLPKPKVAIAGTRVPNAFAMGCSQKSSAVCVMTDLMGTLDDDELGGVTAHELMHVKNYGVIVMTIAPFLLSIASLIIRWGRLFGGDDNHQNALITVTIIVSLAVWVISHLLIRTLSCHREYAADHGAVVTTGHPSALVSALLKISGRMDNIPKRDMRDTSEMNAFFIIPTKFNFIGRLLNTHPSTESHIERLRDMEREVETARVLMGLFDSFHAMLGISAEFGATMKADPEDLFGMSMTYLTMEIDFRFDSADEAALRLSSVDSTDLADIVDAVEDILTARNEETGTEFSCHTDDHGYNWAVLAGDDPGGLMTSVHFAADELTERGYGSRLLAALFGFERDGDRFYWIHSFHRRVYYPFALQDVSTRNQSLKFKPESVLDGELEIESDESYRHPLWPSTPSGHPWD